MAATPRSVSPPAPPLPPNQEAQDEVALTPERDGSDETLVEVPASESPQAPDNDLREFLNQKFESLASKKDIQIVITDIEGVRHNVTEIQDKVRNNTEDIARLQTAVEKISRTPAVIDLPQEDRLAHRGRPSTSPLTPRLGMGRPIPTFITGASCEAQDLARRTKYDESLRTIRIWPILGESQERIRQNLEDFLKNCLLQTSSEVELLGIERVTRVRNQPSQRIHNEVRVTMNRQWAREHIASKGRMLADYVDSENRPTAGIRMDIPDFLATDFRTLDRYGVRMRNTHGKLTKKYVKYDESNLSLILELRLPGDSAWMKITPSLARELVDLSLIHI